jgi:predicted small secreted protein
MKSSSLAVLSLAAISTALTSSCATTKGFGQDLQKVGNRLESRANETGGAEPDRSSAPASSRPSSSTPSAY